MSALVVDASNYTTRRLTSDVLSALKAQGVELVIVQAVDPPAGYPPSQTRQQIQDCLDFGMPVGFYVFWWAFAGVPYLQRHMATLAGFEGKLQFGVVDAEDTSISLAMRASGPGAAWRALRGQAPFVRPVLPEEHVQRQNRQVLPDMRPLLTQTPVAAKTVTSDLLSWFDEVAKFPTLSSQLGIYSGPWYFKPYLGNPTDFVLRNYFWWTAQYDGIPDPAVATTWGGYSLPADLKQFVGSTALAGLSGIDLSVASDALLSLISNPVTPVAPDRTAELETVLHDVTDASGEIVTGLAAAMKPRSLTATRMAVQAVIDRLGVINKQTFGG